MASNILAPQSSRLLLLPPHRQLALRSFGSLSSSLISGPRPLEVPSPDTRPRHRPLRPRHLHTHPLLRQAAQQPPKQSPTLEELREQYKDRPDDVPREIVVQKLLEFGFPPDRAEEIADGAAITPEEVSAVRSRPPVNSGPQWEPKNPLPKVYAACAFLFVSGFYLFNQLLQHRQGTKPKTPNGHPRGL